MIDVNADEQNRAKSPANLKAEDFAIFEDGKPQRSRTSAATDAFFNCRLITRRAKGDEIDLIKKQPQRFPERNARAGIASPSSNSITSGNVLEELTTDREKIFRNKR
ncbi:MAG: hypothetical protein U0Y68_05850 [Blastocatellia bacterium]